MYRLVIIPKMRDNSYGSQFDIQEIKYIINELSPKNISISIIENHNWDKDVIAKYNGVLFIGLADNAKEYLLKPNPKQHIFVWSNNRFDSYVHPELLFNIDIRFEQSLNPLQVPVKQGGRVLLLTTGYQKSHRQENLRQYESDVLFSGGLNRSSRIIRPTYRVEILEAILKAGYTVANYNARPLNQRTIEDEHLSRLNKYPNFKHVDQWATVNALQSSKFVLNLPFPHLGIHNTKDWGPGMQSYESKECDIWYHTWDIFRCIGADVNIITFACPAINKLGLDSSQCHYYNYTPKDIGAMTEQIIDAIKSDEVKQLKESTIEANSYTARWGVIFSCIKDFLPLVTK